MVILFSNRKNKCEDEIIEILCQNGGTYISDKKVKGGNGLFTVISEYKKTELELDNLIAVFLDDTERFKAQTFPKNTIGICENCNINALSVFEENNIPVICCGLNSKNTITLSSFGDRSLLTALQRSITDINGLEIEPSEFKIKLRKSYNPFSVMAASAILLLCGIKPSVFWIFFKKFGKNILKGGVLMDKKTERILSIIMIVVTISLAIIIITGSFVAKNQLKEKDNWVLYTYGNNVALYNGKELIEVFGSISLDTLPEGDKRQLDNGIIFQTKEEALLAIEDYDG